MAQVDKLGKRATADISNNANQVYISDISLFECAIKIRTGRLKLSVDLSKIDTFLKEANIQQIAFDAWAAEQYVALPKLSWADPFDTALIAQAIAKHMTLVTSDYHILEATITGLRALDAKR